MLNMLHLGVSAPLLCFDNRPPAPRCLSRAAAFPACAGEMPVFSVPAFSAPVFSGAYIILLHNNSSFLFQRLSRNPLTKAPCSGLKQTEVYALARASSGMSAAFRHLAVLITIKPVRRAQRGKPRTLLMVVRPHHRWLSSHPVCCAGVSVSTLAVASSSIVFSGLQVSPAQCLSGARRRKGCVPMRLIRVSSLRHTHYEFVRALAALAAATISSSEASGAGHRQCSGQPSREYMFCDTMASCAARRQRSHPLHLCRQ